MHLPPHSWQNEEPTTVSVVHLDKWPDALRGRYLASFHRSVGVSCFCPGNPFSPVHLHEAPRASFFIDYTKPFWYIPNTLLRRFLGR